MIIMLIMMIIVASACRGHHLGLWTLCGQRTARVVWVFSNTLFTIHNTIEDYILVFSNTFYSIHNTIEDYIFVYFRTLSTQYTILRKVGDHLWNYLWKRLCLVLHTMILQILLGLIPKHLKGRLDPWGWRKMSTFLKAPCYWTRVSDEKWTLT